MEDGCRSGGRERGESAGATERKNGENAREREKERKRVARTATFMNSSRGLEWVRIKRWGWNWLLRQEDNNRSFPKTYSLLSNRISPKR